MNPFGAVRLGGTRIIGTIALHAAQVKGASQDRSR